MTTVPRLSPSREQLERLLTEPLTAIVRDHMTLLQTARSDADAIALGHALHTKLLRLTLDLGAALGLQTVPARRHTDVAEPIKIKTPLTYSDAREIADEAFYERGRFRGWNTLERIASALMAVDVASREQTLQTVVPEPNGPLCPIHLTPTVDSKGRPNACGLGACLSPGQEREP